MNSAVPDLTPPGKPAKTPKAEKAPKEPKAPKEAKAPADPNAPKKERAPRTDYGFRPDAVIGLVEGKGDKYRGHRKEWYETVKEHVGKTVADWVAATKKEGGDPPRGWLRFFVQDGSVTLTGGTVPEAKKVEEKPAAPAA